MHIQYGYTHEESKQENEKKKTLYKDNYIQLFQ